MDEREKSTSRPDYRTQRRQRLLTVIIFTSIVCLYVGTRLWHLTASCLWFDEIFSVHAARHSWGQIFSFAAADVVHPPLFYALLKVWIGIGGESLLWLRLLPLLLSLAAIIPFLLLSRELGLTTNELNLALLLMAVNGYLIKYAQELRMYSMLLFLTLCSLSFFVRFLRAETGDKRELLILSAVNLLLVYTHYYGWLIVAVECLYILLARHAHLRRFLTSVAALLLCFGPWVYAVVAAERGQGLAQNIGWVVRPHLTDVAEFYTLLHVPFDYQQSSGERAYSLWSFVASLILFGVPLLVLCWKEFKKGRWATEKHPGLSWLLCFSFLPVLIAFVLGWVLPQSIWGTRHLIIVAGPYAILAATSISRLRPIEAKYTVLLLLGCWFLLAGTMMLLRSEETHIWCAWEQLSGRMKQQQSPVNESVKVYAFEDLVAYHLWFALRDSERGRFHVVVVKGLPGLREDAAYFLPRDFDDVLVQKDSALSGDHIWIAFRDTAWDESHEPLKSALAQGYEVEKKWTEEADGEQAFLVELRRMGSN